MTDQEIINFLRHPAINKSYFAHKLYNYGSITLFYNKLHNRKGEYFNRYELNKLKDIITDLAAYPI